MLINKQIPAVMTHSNVVLLCEGDQQLKVNTETMKINRKSLVLTAEL